MKIVRPLWCAAVALGVVYGTGKAEPAGFQRADPVWPVNLERDMNVLVGFRARITPPPAGNGRLRATGSPLYRVVVNGEFAGHGPTRAAHGWFRVDEWPIGALLHPASMSWPSRSPATT